MGGSTGGRKKVADLTWNMEAWSGQHAVDARGSRFPLRNRSVFRSTECGAGKGLVTGLDGVEKSRKKY